MSDRTLRRGPSGGSPAVRGDDYSHAGESPSNPPDALGDEIRAYYARKNEEAIRCWKEHGPSCNRGCGDSGD